MEILFFPGSDNPKFQVLNIVDAKEKASWKCCLLYLMRKKFMYMA